VAAQETAGRRAAAAGPAKVRMRGAAKDAPMRRMLAPRAAIGLGGGLLRRQPLDDGARGRPR